MKGLSLVVCLYIRSDSSVKVCVTVWYTFGAKFERRQVGDTVQPTLMLSETRVNDKKSPVIYLSKVHGSATAFEFSRLSRGINNALMLFKYQFPNLTPLTILDAHALVDSNNKAVCQYVRWVGVLEASVGECIIGSQCAICLFICLGPEASHRNFATQQ